MPDTDLEEQRRFAAALGDWLAAVPEESLPWAEALLAAALDETAGDADEALALARAAYEDGVGEEGAGENAAGPGRTQKGWITIGGSPGDEGEHEGGTHVNVDPSGKITAGPAALEGKPISHLTGDKKGKKKKPPAGHPSKPISHLTPAPPVTAPVTPPKPTKDKPDKTGQAGKTVPGKVKVDKLRVLRNLGGSTGAELVEDETGKQFVRKRNAKNPGHLRDEAAADAAYRVLGVPVPESKLYETPAGPVKLSTFVPGKMLADLPEDGPEYRAAVKQLRQHFVADALLANWDVVGLENDNILVTPDGTALRIDNGGALRYRAQGKPKGSAFGDKVGELETLRDPEVNPTSAKIFADVTDADIGNQVRNIAGKIPALLAVLPPDLRATVKRRWNWLQQQYGHSPPTPPVAAPVTSPEPSYVGEPINLENPVSISEALFQKTYELSVEPGGLSSAQKEAIEHYTDKGYKALNNQMRECPPPPFTFDCVGKKERKLMENVESALAAAGPLPEPVVCYRGMKLSNEVRAAFLSDARAAQAEGRDYYLPSITSTSMGARSAFESFTGKSSPVLLRIRARKGLYTELITSNKGERELLKSARSRYRVVGVHEKVPVKKGAYLHLATVLYLEEIE